MELLKEYVSNKNKKFNNDAINELSDKRKEIISNNEYYIED